MPDTWLFIPWHVASGPFNMALDAAMLRLPPTRPVLRVYGWHSGGLFDESTGGSPGCVTLGRFQRGLDPAVVGSLSRFGLTRRATGGGAIYHWREVTYSITGSLDSLRLFSGREAAYARFHNAWMAALAGVGRFSKKLLWMPSQRGDSERNDGGERLFCFTRRTGYDVLVDYAEAGLAHSRAHEHKLATLAEAHMPVETPPEGKLIGSAQRHYGKVLLQHGSIKIDTSPLAPWEVSLFDLAPTQRQHWLDQHVSAEIDYAKLSTALAQAFAESLGMKLEVWQPTFEHIELARELAAKQFGQQEWNTNGRVPR